MEVGDIFYKVRYGNKISYYKVEVVSVTKASKTSYSYKYIIRGKSKRKTKRCGGNFRILAYKHLFFVKKIYMLVFLSSRKFHDEFTDQLKHEISVAKVKQLEYFI